MFKDDPKKEAEKTSKKGADCCGDQGGASDCCSDGCGCCVE